ncbi:hypothetical protein JTE90_022215 [Oedothorax gibbosus]|uniref:Uncharacterized protein n=1 Tax=Oedothorax gibbosus TaxID=931172 RepID=A0AAV6UAT0_9ARAC|nr:hypothetical protein JTE90_022215 [Oedothorax gibbosus]
MVIFRTSFLFQTALSVASEGDQVILIRPGSLESPPHHVKGMTEQSAFHMQCIKIVCLSEPSHLLKYLCEFHMQEGCLPAAILIDDIHFYVSHLPQDQSREIAVVKLFALLEDTAAYVSQKKGEPCHRYVSMSRGTCPKNYTKRYFRELWNISTEQSQREGFLTDDHVPAFRAHFHLDDDDREIVVDRVYRLEG